MVGAVTGFVWCKVTRGGGSDLCVAHLAKATQPSSRRSYVHPKPQSELRRWTKTGHKVSFCYYLSLSRAHTNAHKHEKASRPVLLHSMFVHLFLSAQQEMYASPRSINKHAHTQAKAYTHTHTFTYSAKQTGSHCKYAYLLTQANKNALAVYKD